MKEEKTCHHTPKTRGLNNFFPNETLCRDILHNMTAQGQSTCITLVVRMINKDHGIR